MAGTSKAQAASGIWRYVACLSAGALHDCRGRIADSSFGAKLTCRSGTLLEILPNMCSHQICGSLVTLRKNSGMLLSCNARVRVGTVASDRPGSISARSALLSCHLPPFAPLRRSSWLPASTLELLSPASMGSTPGWTPAQFCRRWRLWHRLMGRPPLWRAGVAV